MKVLCKKEDRVTCDKVSGDRVGFVKVGLVSVLDKTTDSGLKTGHLDLITVLLRSLICKN